MLNLNAASQGNWKRKRGKTNWLAVGLLSGFGAAALALLIGTNWARSQQAAGKGSYGVVSIDAIQRGFKGYAKARQELRKLDLGYQEQMRTRDAFSLLSTEEWQELRALLNKKSRSTEEEDRFLKLRGLNNERQEDLRKLQTISPERLSESEKARLKELASLWQASRMDLKKLDEERQQQLAGQQDSVAEQVDKQVRSAVAQVAEKEGIDFVFARETLLFARHPAIDITEKVLQALNKE